MRSGTGTRKRHASWSMPAHVWTCGHTPVRHPGNWRCTTATTTLPRSWPTRNDTGTKRKPRMSDVIRPRPFAVSDAALDDLRERLRRTRWPEPEPVPDWSQGVPSRTLRALCDYWRDTYDWRACEARLNALDPSTTHIDGL